MKQLLVKSMPMPSKTMIKEFFSVVCNDYDQEFFGKETSVLALQDLACLNLSGIDSCQTGNSVFVSL